MNKKNILTEKIEKIIREYDVNKKLTEKEYKKISRLFSILVRTNPEVRQIFFAEVKTLSKKVTTKYEDLNNEILEKLLASEKKEKIFN